MSETMSDSKLASAEGSWLQRFLRWGVATEGSTRACGLMRMALALCLWMRFSDWLLLFDGVAEGRALFCVLFYVATTMMFFGVQARIGTALSAFCALMLYGYYGHHQDYDKWTHHHVYILTVGTLLISLTPCDRSFSFDRWWRVKKARERGEAPPPERGNLFGQRLIVLQLSSLYLWTAFNKTDLGFLSGDRLEHILLWFYPVNYPEGVWLHPIMLLVAVGTVLLEYALALGMPFKRFRKYLVIPGMLLHGLFYVLLPVSTFTLTMWTLYLAYFDPDDLHAFVDSLVSDRAQPA